MAFRKLIATFADKWFEDAWHELNRRIEQATASIVGTPDAIYCGAVNGVPLDAAQHALKANWQPGDPGDFPFVAPRDGTLANFQALCRFPPRPPFGANVTVEVYVNGAPTGLSVSLSLLSLWGIDAVNTIAVSQGDRIEFIAQAGPITEEFYAYLTCAVEYL